jgi:hypothetical protein
VQINEITVESRLHMTSQGLQQISIKMPERHRTGYHRLILIMHDALIGSERTTHIVYAHLAPATGGIIASGYGYAVLHITSGSEYHITVHHEPLGAWQDLIYGKFDQLLAPPACYASRYLRQGTDRNHRVTITKILA